ncbi:tetratricopeptide repeat protein [Spongiibacter sp. KMU-158]|uniref:Ancillary SecYEG translocon subunit n=1 Tax=Spongiibacter pelagi TaxID=2760804 RepID=A0A927GVP3_9GAMM|nr:tetratricopeptide repeat protein [Spongiibacter pelagi]MBD2858288.1 tetratricopeptide repeat protein [Spongiibacter pelagi]
METYRTEEEQVKAIKSWWRDNGKQTVIGIALALGLVFGWKFWQGHSAERSADASVIFDQLMQADEFVRRDGSKLGTAKQLAAALKSEFSSVAYGQYGALMLAKYAVQEGDYATAEAELNWVLAKKPAVELAGQAQMRLAQIKFAQADYAGARSQLDAIKSGYAAEIAELRGDIALAEGDEKAALEFYVQAQSLNRAQELPSNNPLLPMKISNLKNVQKPVTVAQETK